MTHTTWILVAHRAGASLFSQAGKHQPLHIEEVIDHPEGRLRNREIDTDTGGRSFDSMGNQRHTMSTPDEPTEHVADKFCKTLARKLRAARTSGRCDDIILVAGPRLLGKLRLALDRSTAKLVSRGLDKDFGDVRDEDLATVVAEAIQT
jgi:protein required for attachment to host cells